jgi:hypothetical protein
MIRRKALIPIAVLVGLPLVLYAPFLFGGQVLYWGVYLLQFFPWRQLAVEQIRAGHWPLWNPYLGAGTPLAANLQTAVFYPPNILSLLMPVDQAFGWLLALHVALAALFTYHLGRTLGLSRFGALVAGLAYGGGGYLLAHWVFPSMVYAAAWLPLMLSLAERVVTGAMSGRRRGIGYRIADIALLGLAVGLQLLAGHAQTCFYSLLIVAAFGLWRVMYHALQTGVEGWTGIGPAVTGLASLVAGALGGVALAAVQLLPTAELAAHSQRAGTLSDLRFAFELSFWPWRLITLLAPDFFGNPARNEYWAYGTYWEEAAYAGVLALVLAAVALAAWWQKRKAGDRGTLVVVPFLTILCLVSVVLAMGDHTPLYPLLFRYVPGFGLFQAPARLLIGYALGVALLAGIGADAFRLTPRTRSTLRILLLAGLGTALAGMVARLMLPAIQASFGDSMIRLGVTLGLIAGLLLLRGRRLRGRRWEALVVALVAGDLLAFGWGLAPGTDPVVYRAPVDSAIFLESQAPGRVAVAPAYAEEMYDEYVSLRVFGSDEPTVLQGLRESLLPNLNTVHHLPGVGNYDPLTVGPYRDLWDRVQGVGSTMPNWEEAQPLLNLSSARYIVDGLTDRWTPLPPIYESGVGIYRNDAALPRAWIVSQARIVPGQEDRLNILSDPAFDPRVEVVLNQTPPGAPAEATSTISPAGTAAVLDEEPDRVVIQVEATQGGYLVLADTYYPGWQATVDGEPVEILAANHAFRAVTLGAGQHTVVFRYAPSSFRLGGWITLGAVVLLATALTVAWWQGRAS